MAVRRIVNQLAASAALVLATAGCASQIQPSTAGSAPAPTAPSSGHTPMKTPRPMHPASNHPQTKATKPTKAVPVAGVPAVDLPDPSLTPGAVLTTTRSVVCVSGYASTLRNVPDSEKEAVYSRYGIPHVPYAHEVDHLISLELGGSNAITNLWPEPYQGTWGARTKDTLENRLHALVCAGQLSLVRAQHLEATNWVAAYRRYLGTPPPATPATSPSGPTVSSGPTTPTGGCEPGYSPCLPRVTDLDCSDIPDSKKPVKVTGSDPYRLDADHDGWGCTS